MAENMGNNNVSKLSDGKQAGDFLGAMDITDETSIEDIAKSYDDLGKQYSEMATNAFNDVSARQTELIGNDFGSSPMNYSTYYDGAQTGFQSAMRVSGTQFALETGMNRAKAEAESALQAAKQSYSNSVTDLQNAQARQEALENAKNDPTAVEVGTIGEGTSGSELINYASLQDSGSASEAYSKIAPTLGSDNLVKDWNDQSSRSSADNEAFKTAKSKGLVSEDAKLEDNWGASWWQDPDVSNAWTYTYTYDYANKTYGAEKANEYKSVYDNNYEIVKNLFDLYTGKVSEIDNSKTFQIMYADDTITPVYDTSIEFTDYKEETVYNTLRDEYENYKSRDDLTAEEEAKKTSIAEALAKILADKYTEKEPERQVNEGIKSSNAKKVNKTSTTNKEFSDLVEAAFGFDLASGEYLNKMRTESPDTYNKLLHDYSMVLTYGQVFEVADGNTSYHTSDGDKVLEEGTYVYYTLPGMEDDPNLTKYMELRSQAASATTEAAKDEYEAAAKEQLELYSKTVNAALFASNYADCDVTDNIVHSTIYSKNPTYNSSKTLTVFNGKTVSEVIEAFTNLQKTDGEAAYAMLTKIVNKSASNSGSYWSMQNGALSRIETKDSVGRDMIGSNADDSKGNTLFSDNDIANLSVEDAVALFNVIGTSMDQYNGGITSGNIDSGFLKTAGKSDWNYWWENAWTEGWRGIVGTADMIFNGCWSAASGISSVIDIIATGREWNDTDTDAMFKSARWGGGTWLSDYTGNDSLYQQFLGDYKEGTLGYDLSNESRMIENMMSLTTPILEDVWFGDEDAQASLGNTQEVSRTVSQVTSGIGGLLISVVGPTLLLKGAGALAGYASSSKVGSAVSSAANKLKSLLSKTAVDEILNYGDDLLNLPSNKAVDVLSNYVDDAANVTDDVLTAASNSYADDLAKITTGSTDDIANIAANAAAKNMTKMEQVTEAFNTAVSSETSAIKGALGAVATSSDDVLSAAGELFIKYSKEALKGIYSGLDDVGIKALDDTVAKLGESVSMRTFRQAYLSTYTGLSVESLQSVSDDVMGLLSNIAFANDGGASKLSQEIIDYIRTKSSTEVKELVASIADRANIAFKTGNKWTMDDTVRLLANKGWDEKRTQLLLKDYLKDRIQDYGVDILQGYIMPRVTNEGTDRETIDEYLTNPLNYITNEGFFILQHGGSKIFNRIASTVETNRLDKAYRALDAARSAGDNLAVEKRSKQVLKLSYKAQQYADKCLDKNISTEELLHNVEKTSNYVDDAYAAMQDGILRKLTNQDISGMSTKDFSDSANGKLSVTEDMFHGYNNGVIRAHAKYGIDQKMLGFENGGLASIDDNMTQARILKAMADGREAYLKEAGINIGSVTMEQQKKIYRKMVDAACDYANGSIPGLRKNLEYYTEELMKMAKNNDRLRAGYLPIESFLNNNFDGAPALRGFSQGDNLLDLQTANPYLERSISLKDTNILDALIKGETVLKMVDAEGNVIVDEAGNAVTRDINIKGANILDSLTCAQNAYNFHNTFDPIIGKNGEDVGVAALKNGSATIRATGGIETALNNDKKKVKQEMQDLVDKANPTKEAKKTDARAKKTADARAKKIVEKDTAVKEAVVAKAVSDDTTSKVLNDLEAKKTGITEKRAQYPARIMGFVDKDGNLDVKAGYEVYDHYKALVERDLMLFQKGDINRNTAVITDEYVDYSKFSWEYKKKGFGKPIKGVIQPMTVSKNYMDMLEKASKNGGQVDADIVMRRMLESQTASPVKEINGKFVPYTTTSSTTGAVYKWRGPISDYNPNVIPSIGVDDNVEVSKWLKQGSEELGWSYTDAKGKEWTRADFDGFEIKTNKDLKTAKEIYLENSGLSGNDTAKRMLDTAAAQSNIKNKTADKFMFADFVDDMDDYLADNEVFTRAFDSNSKSNGVFKNLNSLQNNSYTMNDIRDYLAEKIRSKSAKGENYSTEAKAYAMVVAIEDHGNRAKGLGGFDPYKMQDEGVDLFNDSSLAGEQNKYSLENMIDKNLAGDEDYAETSNLYKKASKNKTALESLNAIENTLYSKESFNENLDAFNEQLQLFINDNADSIQSRNKRLKEVNSILDDTDKLIQDSAKDNLSISNKISAEANSRNLRQKNYTATSKKNYDALSAYGITANGRGYTLTKTPSEYYAAKNAASVYKEYKNDIDYMKKFIDVASPKDKSEAISQYRDFLRKLGVDSSVGYDLEYSIRRLEGGTLGGQLKQVGTALDELEGTLTTDLKNLALSDGTRNNINERLGKIRAIRERVATAEQSLMPFERLDSLYDTSTNDSMEQALVFTMADLVDTTNALDQSKSYNITKDGKVSFLSSKQSKSLTGFTKKELSNKGFTSDVVSLDVDGKKEKITVEVLYGASTTDVESSGIQVNLRREDGSIIPNQSYDSIDIDTLNDSSPMSSRGIKLIKENKTNRYILENTEKGKADVFYADTGTWKEKALALNREEAWNEWLTYTSDIDDVSKKIDTEKSKVAKAKKDIDATASKETKKKVVVDDENVTYSEAERVVKEGDIKNSLNAKDYARYKQLEEQLKYINDYEVSGKGTVYRSADGFFFLPDDAPNIENYATFQNHLDSLGYVPKGEEAKTLTAKEEKKARKAMRKEITKNLNKGKQGGKVEDFTIPKDLDTPSRRASIANLEALAAQINKATGMDLSYNDILISKDFSNLMTRINQGSVAPTKVGNFINGLCEFSQAIQNIQLAGGASFVNALTITQLRGAIFQDPRKMMEYIKVVGDMKNSRAVNTFAKANMERLSQIAWESGDMSILNDFSTAISARRGASDGGVMQNVINNTINFKQDWADVKAKNNNKFFASFKDILEKDVQNTIFEDATFANAMPVLRAKMLIENYDAAASILSKKFKDMPADELNKAANLMSYAKTTAFFSPSKVLGNKDISTMLDNVADARLRDFTSKYVNAKPQTTVLDCLTDFFFALRYKMMLSGRVADGALGGISMIKNGIKSRGATEATAEALNAVGTSFMHSGSVAGLGSLATCAVVAAATSSALGIPTAWDDVSFTDEYDGSFKVPDILQKFQTIGQIWLPNAYSEDRGLYIDPNQTAWGIDTMSSIFTLQNSLFRTVDKIVNPENQYQAPQRGLGLLGQEIGITTNNAVNDAVNTPFARAIGDELIASNLLSPFKAMYEVIMNTTYYGNNIWERKYLPDGSENKNYDPGRNIAASVMHILGLDQVLDGGKGYNDWVKGKVDSDGNLLDTYVEQDQVGTVSGSGVLQHEFLSAAKSLMDGDYLDAITEAGELPLKSKKLSSTARTEFNNKVKNIIASYSEDYKNTIANSSTVEQKDEAYKKFVEKSANAVATWSKKYGYLLGENQQLVASTTRILMSMLSGEYDDNMYYVQDAYWKASKEAQIEGVTSESYWLDDEDLKDWIANGKTAEEFAEEKNKRTKAYNDAIDSEYKARKALIDAGYPEEYLSGYKLQDFKSEQRSVNKKIFTELTAKLDSKIGQFDNFKEMKAYYEDMIDSATTTSKKATIANKYNQYVFDILAPYVDETTGYGAAIINDAYYNGTGLANYLTDYVIMPADKTYYGKSPVASYIKDYFGVGYRNASNMPSDAEIQERFITAQNLMMKGSVSSSISVLDNLVNAVKSGKLYASDADYSKIINMRAILSARSK